MPWTLQPKWLAGKGLPLLGAILLQKTEKKEPQWNHRRVMYLSHLGRVDSRVLGDEWCPMGTKLAIALGFDLGWNIPQTTWESSN